MGAPFGVLFSSVYEVARCVSRIILKYSADNGSSSARTVGNNSGLLGYRDVTSSTGVLWFTVLLRVIRVGQQLEYYVLVRWCSAM